MGEKTKSSGEPGEVKKLGGVSPLQIRPKAGPIS